MSFRNGFLAMGGALGLNALSVTFGLGAETYEPIPGPPVTSTTLNEAVGPPTIALSPAAQEARGQVVVSIHRRRRKQTRR